MVRLIVLALAAASAVTLNASPAGATTYYFANCTSLHRVFPHGVARSVAAANYQVRTHHARPATSSYAQKVYATNSRLDRDHDGTACEN